MLSHLGLRSRMAASYVLVSAAAVLLVEAVLLAVTVSRIRSADEVAHQAQERAVEAEKGLGQLKAQGRARNLAAAVAKQATVSATGVPAGADETLIAKATATSFAGYIETDQRNGGSATAEPTAIVQVVADASGRVIASSPATAFPATSTLPQGARTGGARDGQKDDQDHVSYWASAPIQVSAADGGSQRTIGIAYVEISDSATRPESSGNGGAKAEPTVTPGDENGTVAGSGQQTDSQSGQQTDASSGDTTIGSLVVPGIVALVLLLPVGALFGLLSTGRLIRRIRRLGEGTSAMAEGDLQVRIPVSGGDEVGRLEQAFNSMAERLDAAVAEQRATAGAEARRAERGRIARELHDSISQDLFSVSLVAAGLRKALAPGSVLQEQAESMERSLVRTMREMRALLLELRPIQLEDAGLAAALDELCRAYEARLGIPVTAHLAPVSLDAQAEHAVLRVVQEALGNAIRHGEPSSIELRLATVDGRVEVTVRDDGRGFDPQSTSGRHGMGLGLMRERIRELGGVVKVGSTPDHGTTVRVSLPVHAGEPVG
jgi:signal transduction histidine kinase